MEPSEQKAFDAISRLPPFRRYEHFVKCVADREDAWTVDRALPPQVTASEPFPLWPDREFAEASMQAGWGTACLRTCSLATLIERTLRELGAVGVPVEVFPISPGSGLIVPAKTLWLDLRSTVEEWYGGEYTAASQ